MQGTLGGVGKDFASDPHAGVGGALCRRDDEGGGRDCLGLGKPMAIRLREGGKVWRERFQGRTASIVRDSQHESTLIPGVGGAAPRLEHCFVHGWGAVFQGKLPSELRSRSQLINRLGRPWLSTQAIVEVASTTNLPSRSIR